MISELCNRVFEQAINDYHAHNDIDFAYANPYPAGSFENLLYTKCWIDTAQWHMEDEVRDPEIAPADAHAGVDELLAVHAGNHAYNGVIKRARHARAAPPRQR